MHFLTNFHNSLRNYIFPKEEVSTIYNRSTTNDEIVARNKRTVLLENLAIFHLAIKENEVTAVKEFIKDDDWENLQGPDKKGRSVLHWAMAFGNNEVARLIIKKITNKRIINLHDKNGRTALHYAAMAGRNDLAKLLFIKGAKMNSRDRKGMTPLHYAAQNSSPFFIHALMVRGADKFIKDRERRLPYDIAVWWRNSPKIIQWLDPNSLEQIQPDKYLQKYDPRPHPISYYDQDLSKEATPKPVIKKPSFVSRLLGSSFEKPINPSKLPFSLIGVLFQNRNIPISRVPPPPVGDVDECVEGIKVEMEQEAEQHKTMILKKFNIGASRKFRIMKNLTQGDIQQREDAMKALLMRQRIRIHEEEFKRRLERERLRKLHIHRSKVVSSMQDSNIVKVDPKMLKLGKKSSKGGMRNRNIGLEYDSMVNSQPNNTQNINTANNKINQPTNQIILTQPVSPPIATTQNTMSLPSTPQGLGNDSYNRSVRQKGYKKQNLPREPLTLTMTSKPFHMRTKRIKPRPRGWHTGLRSPYHSEQDAQEPYTFSNTNLRKRYHFPNSPQYLDNHNKYVRAAPQVYSRPAQEISRAYSPQGGLMVKKHLMWKNKYPHQFGIEKTSNNINSRPYSPLAECTVESRKPKIWPQNSPYYNNSDDSPHVYASNNRTKLSPTRSRSPPFAYYNSKPKNLDARELYPSSSPTRWTSRPNSSNSQKRTRVWKHTGMSPPHGSNSERYYPQLQVGKNKSWPSLSGKNIPYNNSGNQLDKTYLVQGGRMTNRAWDSLRHSPYGPKLQQQYNNAAQGNNSYKGAWTMQNVPYDDQGRRRKIGPLDEFSPYGDHGQQPFRLGDQRMRTLRNFDSPWFSSKGHSRWMEASPDDRQHPLSMRPFPRRIETRKRSFLADNFGQGRYRTRAREIIPSYNYNNQRKPDLNGYHKLHFRPWKRNSFIGDGQDQAFNQYPEIKPTCWQNDHAFGNASPYDGAAFTFEDEYRRSSKPFFSGRGLGLGLGGQPFQDRSRSRPLGLVAWAARALPGLFGKNKLNQMLSSSSPRGTSGGNPRGYYGIRDRRKKKRPIRKKYNYLYLRDPKALRGPSRQRLALTEFQGTSDRINYINTPKVRVHQCVDKEKLLRQWL